MNVLIVHAHPEPQSFCTAMAAAATQELTAAGHTVTLSDLYAIDFDPVARRSDFRAPANPDYLVYALEQRHAVASGTLADDVRGELDKLLACDMLVLNFPIYWFSVPAILKGWIDRVLVSGKVYGGLRFYDRGGLVGKRVLVTATLGGQPHMFGPGAVHGPIEDMLRPLLRGTLAYTGMSVLAPFFAYHVPYLPQHERDEIMAAYRARLRSLDNDPALPFPSLGDFDDQLHPKTGLGTPAHSA